jgi:hypothetical protein
LGVLYTTGPASAYDDVLYDAFDFHDDVDAAASFLSPPQPPRTTVATRMATKRLNTVQNL